MLGLGLFLGAGVPRVDGGGGDTSPGGEVDVLTDDDEVTALLDDDGSTFLTDD
jgi:hypothetical protein